MTIGKYFDDQGNPLFTEDDSISAGDGDDQEDGIIDEIVDRWLERPKPDQPDAIYSMLRALQRRCFRQGYKWGATETAKEAIEALKERIYPEIEKEATDIEEALGKLERHP